ncbi:MAG: acyl-CoA desaturase [Solirubrobacterales bacterium]|jgi:stearoyl-CoA desaturase (delta-9 desaturase)|nr:acyl-CoA desaturase [Solirubrobacterales bacterium]
MTEVTEADIQPTANEKLDRFLTGTVTVVPFLALILVGIQAWNRTLHVSDLIVFLIMYVGTGLGITIGFHRMLTHRSFETSKPVKAAFAILGSAAIEGPVVSWVADHRKHHAFTDREGDPHSPHVDHGHGLKGILKGLFHAHVGWLFVHTQRASKERYAKDLIDDPVISWVNRWFFGWVLLGLLVPFLLGWAIGGSLQLGLTGLLWGGAVRMLVLHHVTYSINSLCHVFGSRRFETDDHSRNLTWLFPLAFGENFHNNHHAFPTSARHGLGPRQFDSSAAVIGLMEKVGLVWDVKRPSEAQQARKLIPTG